MLDKVKVRIDKRFDCSYDICLGLGVINNIKDYLPKDCSSIVIVTDKMVEKLHAKNFIQKLKKLGYSPLLLTVEPGEDSKCTKVKEELELKILQAKCDRRTVLIALGGGVIGDLTGYIAATYMRGIRYIQIPTTLLAAIDSSVGGKTGINTLYGKNLIGAIWQPIAVITDLELLDTLPQNQLVNGLIEAIKIFLTSDKTSFFYLQRNLPKILKRESKVLQHVIKKAVKLKANIVKKDEREENLRMILNFGHTVGHALEKLSDYEILHGFCVALGIIVEANIAVLQGVLSVADVDIIVELLAMLGINAEMLRKFRAENIIQHMLIDKKNKNGDIYMILLDQIGSVYTINSKVAIQVSPQIIQKAFKELI